MENEHTPSKTRNYSSNHSNISKTEKEIKGLQMGSQITPLSRKHDHILKREVNCKKPDSLRQIQHVFNVCDHVCVYSCTGVYPCACVLVPVCVLFQCVYLRMCVCTQAGVCL